MLWWAFTSGMLAPVGMIACYPVFRCQSRRKPNGWSGYRTERAMKNQRNWRAAQLLCATYWLRIGVGLAIAALIAFAALYLPGNRNLALWQAVSLFFAFTPLAGLLWSCVQIERRLSEMDEANPATSNE
jgi:uncharacterized membrane protein